jgi:hypothetical protein
MLGKLNTEFKVRDLFKHYHGTSPVTFGGFEEKVLTYKTEVGTLQCLDYMFEIIFSVEDEQSLNSVKYILILGNVKVGY